MTCRKITVAIQTGNDAFVNRRRSETARILREAADKLEHEVMTLPFALIDINGNNVGECYATPRNVINP